MLESIAFFPTKREKNHPIINIVCGGRGELAWCPNFFVRDCGFPMGWTSWLFLIFFLSSIFKACKLASSLFGVVYVGVSPLLAISPFLVWVLREGVSSLSLVSQTLELITSVSCSSQLSELTISLSLETNLLAVNASALAKAAFFNNCSFHLHC